MTIEQQDELQEQAPGRDQVAAWLGEPIRFSWEGDRHLYGMLVSNVRLPGRHVHPQVREAGVRVVAAQTKHNGLTQKLADRPGERAQLKRKLAQDEDSDGSQLKAFDADTEVIEARCELAEEAVRDALTAFSAALAANAAEWDEYLRERGLEALHAPVGHIEDLPAWSAEVQLIDDLLSRHGVDVAILHIDPNDFATTHAHSLRHGTIHSILGGVDLPGDQGRQYAVSELKQEFQRVFTARPKPAQAAPEFEPLETEPERLVRERGTGPKRPVDKFYRSD